MIAALVDCLATFYQTGDLAQMEMIARSMLAAIPDDLVALQFLGLALYQGGHMDGAYRLFKRAADSVGHLPEPGGVTDCESASSVSYREATRAHSGLADGWYRIALAMRNFGLHQPASRAFAAAAQARGAGAATSAGAAAGNFP